MHIPLRSASLHCSTASPDKPRALPSIEHLLKEHSEWKAVLGTTADARSSWTEGAAQRHYPAQAGLPSGLDLLVAATRTRHHHRERLSARNHPGAGCSGFNRSRQRRQLSRTATDSKEDCRRDSRTNGALIYAQTHSSTPAAAEVASCTASPGRWC